MREFQSKYIGSRLAEEAMRALLVGQPDGEAGPLEVALRARGLTVRRARTARDALTASQGFAPDLMVLNWQSLDVTGKTFLRMLLDEKLPHLPCIFANAAPFDLPRTDQNDALVAGADLTLPGAPSGDDIDTILAVAARHRHRQANQKEKTRRVVARLTELQQQFESMDHDLSEAKKLQQGLLRDRHLDLGATQISLILRSSGHVGGDLVGHFPINEDVTGFFAIDVSGHGVSSALMTARLAGYLSTTDPGQNIAVTRGNSGWDPRSPAAVVTDLNQLVMDDLETEHYFTMILGYVDPRAGRLVFAQAGHPHPVRQTIDGRVEFVIVGGLPVGLIPGADYEDTFVTLEDGERFLLLSDGFTEATLPDGTFLGEQGLAKLLSASRDQKGPELFETLVWDLSQAIGDEAFQDDLSGVAFEFNGSPKS